MKGCPLKSAKDRLRYRHEPFQLAILLPQLPKLPELGHPESSQALPPPEERRLAGPQLPSDRLDRRAGLALPDRHHHLLLRASALPHRSVLRPFSTGQRPDRKPTSKREPERNRKPGEGPRP